MGYYEPCHCGGETTSGTHTHIVPDMGVKFTPHQLNKAVRRIEELEKRVEVLEHRNWLHDEREN